MTASNTGPAGSTYTDTTSLSEESGRNIDSRCAQSPKVAVQNRKRRVLSNPGRGKRRCSSSSTSSEPKRVTPQQRIKEFPGEQLVVSSYKLFCRACREELNLKRSTIQNHVRSVKHVEGKDKMAIVNVNVITLIDSSSIF